jgi:hypothetical protein
MTESPAVSPPSPCDATSFEPPQHDAGVHVVQSQTFDCAMLEPGGHGG